MHSGISSVNAYQLWISAIGPQPQSGLVPKNVYPWLGFRIGVIGNPGS
ncbi:hypothetical protein [Streptomyces sp. NPDC059761]